MAILMPYDLFSTIVACSLLHYDISSRICPHLGFTISHLSLAVFCSPGRPSRRHALLPFFVFLVFASLYCSLVVLL